MHAWRDKWMLEGEDISNKSNIMIECIVKFDVIDLLSHAGLKRIRHEFSSNFSIVIRVERNLDGSA